MANWGVALARRPTLNRRWKHHKSRRNAGAQSPIIDKLDPMHPLQQELQRNVFRNLCQPDEEAHDCEEYGCDRITINVSGLYFITRRSVLEAHPATVLGDALKREPYYDHIREEYFFDRHRPTFESIFHYYQYGGKLKRPPSVPDDIFLDECEFFELEHEIVEEYKKAEGYTETIYEYPKNPIMAKIWASFEYPETSRFAFIIGLISVFATIVSIITFCVETLPAFKKVCEEPIEQMLSNDTNVTLTTVILTNSTSIDYEKVFFIIETICNVWFTIEAVVRYISCPNHLLFWKDFKNIVDIMAIVPYYVSLGQVMHATESGQCSTGNSFAFLRVIRLIRVFKLTKHSQGLQILLLTFRSSIEGLTLFLLTLMVCILVFSSMIYYCEIGEPKAMITSIPDGFWWAVITMCTVGYGDVVPVGPLGKLVGTVCALSGVLTLAIPVPIITENFNKFYAHKQRESKSNKNRNSGPSSMITKAKDAVVRAAMECQSQILCKEPVEQPPVHV